MLLLPPWERAGGEVDNTVAAAEESSQSEIVANYVHFSFLTKGWSGIGW